MIEKKIAIDEPNQGIEYDNGNYYQWSNEPDYAVYLDKVTGLDYVIKRIPPTGHLCGYVIIPDGKKVDFTSDIIEDLEVHGGITFTEPVEWYTDIESGFKCDYALGFDCAHAGDLKPLDLTMGSVDGWIYRDINYVQNECKKLARQIKNIIDKNTKNTL